MNPFLDMGLSPGDRILLSGDLPAGLSPRLRATVLRVSPIGVLLAVDPGQGEPPVPHDDGLMPPPRAKNPLSDQQIATLKQWIAAGAPYAKHWAFEVPRQEATPKGEHPVDFFVKRRLVAGEADNDETLLAAISWWLSAHPSWEIAYCAYNATQARSKARSRRSSHRPMPRRGTPLHPHSRPKAGHMALRLR